ncbi:hypothetical protein JQX13_23845 [Archangium violaceum]|uniref:hypothetical protein n=1 Tax=Archangium violaceum TaxID=83451 RepID=UPI00193C2C99|nr:hypothetical protein [Archangium violaceum]QRK12799.1 hypothetical protein JQX13_23845 [Archangium violaceum]
MSKQTRYLLTVDSATGAAVRLERLGEAGDLTEVPLSTLTAAPLGVTSPAPAAGGGAPLSPQSLVINIYMGGPQQAAPLSLSLPGLIGPGAPGGPAPSTTTIGPGGPGGPAPSASLAGPGGPGGFAGPAPSGTAGGEEGGSR